MPASERSAEYILVIPAIGGATAINFVDDPEVQDKFMQGTLEEKDYMQYLDRGVMHFHGTAGIDEPGVSYIAGHSSSADLPRYSMQKDNSHNVFKALGLLEE